MTLKMAYSCESALKSRLQDPAGEAGSFINNTSRQTQQSYAYLWNFLFPLQTISTADVTM